MMKKLNVFSVLNWIMFAAFGMSVIVQYNDPDPLVWMLMYGAAAVATFLRFRGQLHWGISLTVGLIALVWAATLAPHVIGKVGFSEMFESYEMKSTPVEMAREMGGLLIITFWMGVLTLKAYQKQ